MLLVAYQLRHCFSFRADREFWGKKLDMLNSDCHLKKKNKDMGRMRKKEKNRFGVAFVCRRDEQKPKTL